MSKGTSIEWARHPVTGKGASLNPIRARNVKTGKVGWHCEHTGQGCKNFYSGAQNLNTRNLSHGGTGLPFKPGHLQNGDIELFFDEKILTEALNWKTGHGIFWCSMTDMYVDFVPDEWLDKIKAVQALTPQHIHFELTKRPQRRLDYLRSRAAARPWEETEFQGIKLSGVRRGKGYYYSRSNVPPWPLPNVWQGASAATQEEADDVVPIVLQTPAARRFMSLEPLLGPIDLKRWAPIMRPAIRADTKEPFLAPHYFMTRCELCGWFGSSELCDLSHNWDDADVVCPNCKEIFLCDEVGRGVDWIVAGGESGHQARPMHPDWARALRDQCAAAGVPFFFKQWGEFHPASEHDPDHCEATPDAIHVSGAREHRPSEQMRLINEGNGWAGMCRLGKSKAGRQLDGIEHNAMPEAT